MTYEKNLLYFTMLLGIDILTAVHYKMLKGMKIGLCTNLAATDRRLKPTIDLLRNQKCLMLKAVFAPEHGIFGALQDQISAGDMRFHGVPVISLYGKRLKPNVETLNQSDIVVIDLVDIGTRYYTFIWTALLLIKQCAELKKPVLVLDRPNPLGGCAIEGPVLEKNFSSFVGLYPIPVRHGMTIAELCNFINKEHSLGAKIETIRMKGWQRQWYFDQTGLFWTLPSPNMPCFKTACVYPGMGLLEGTNISEGRGTTKPFEIFGAPWIDSNVLVKTLEKEPIKGVMFRPMGFKPTFHKYHGLTCGGAQIFIKDIRSFKPVLVGLAIIKTIKKLYPMKFAWRKPPYEREKKKMPFDILIGNSWVRQAIEDNRPIVMIEKKWRNDLDKFVSQRKKYLLYP